MFFTAALRTRRQRMEMFIGVTFFPSECLPFTIILTFVYLLLAFDLGKFLLWEYALECTPRTILYKLLPYQSLSCIHLLSKSFIVHVPPSFLTRYPTAAYHSNICVCLCVQQRCAFPPHESSKREWDETRRWIISRNYVVNYWHYFLLALKYIHSILCDILKLMWVFMMKIFKSWYVYHLWRFY
jgi:hypothetical protein